MLPEMSPPAIIDIQSPTSSFNSGRSGPCLTRSKPRFIKQRRSFNPSSSTPSAGVLPCDSHFNPFRSETINNLSNGNISNGNSFGFDTNVNSGLVFLGSSSVNYDNLDDVAADGSVFRAGASSSGVCCNNNDDIAGNGRVSEVGVSSSGVYCNKNDIAGNARAFEAGASSSGVSCNNNDKVAGNGKVLGGDVSLSGVYCNSSNVADKDVVNNGFRGSGIEKHGVESEPFVFGASGKVRDVNVDGKCGGVGLESELVDEIRKLNIENKEKGKEKGASVEAGQVCDDDTSASNEGESFFVFKSCRRDTDGFRESWVPPKEEGHCNLDAQKIDENVFVFGCSNSEERGTFSSSSMEFKLPDLNSSPSFSETLLGGLDAKDYSPSTRVLKDKKPKGKSRQSKLSKKQPLWRPASNHHVAQEEETHGCYSPMDFSPYQASTSNHDVSLGIHQTCQQTEAENKNSSVSHPESQPNQMFMSRSFGAASTDASDSVSSHTSGHDSNTTQFCFSSNSNNITEEKFASPVTNSAQTHISSVKHLHKKKYRLKNAKTSATRDALKSKGETVFVFDSKYKSEAGVNQDQGYDSALNEAEKACDKWRRRGNEAYEKGELSKAENFYTWGVNCIPPGDESGAASRPLVRCYSNRAATRMALGRVREAILDCLAAVKMDPTFHRAQMRAANCYLQLGELEEAMQCFHKLMDSTTFTCLDRQVVISASEGIQKSQKVFECMRRCAELLKLKTSDAAASALELITHGLSISIYSEKLLEMKAEALCMLGNHEEAITLCQQSLGFAEKNFIDLPSYKHKVKSSCLNVSLWRNRISSKCYFHMGRLEAALDVLEKSEFPDESSELPCQLAKTMNELLKRKNAGNDAFKLGKHAEAIEHYTSAISSSIESRPFAAICFCNRAASHQALGQIADAIADCSLAITLDEDYTKAVYRRATLHEMIRDYKQAVADLQRLISILKKQSREKSKQSGSGNGKELRQVQQHLSKIEEEAKKDVHLDLYLILGCKKTDVASEIKKAYRKAALRHHPDKACQSLVRGDVGDEGHNWKDIAELVRKDSDRLFKMIGEAYAVLSDVSKREEYDNEEDMRKALKESNDLRRGLRRHSDHSNHQGYPFERSNNRRYWQDHYKTYTYQRW